MNVNSQIQKLEELTGIPVRPDIYEGAEEAYIVYTYADEHPVLFGDDKPLADAAEMQVSLYTPLELNNMALKHLIRDYLETLGEVSFIGSWVDTYTNNRNLEEKKRHTTFTVTITKARR